MHARQSATALAVLLALALIGCATQGLDAVEPDAIDDHGLTAAELSADGGLAFGFSVAPSVDSEPPGPESAAWYTDRIALDAPGSVKGFLQAQSGLTESAACWVVSFVDFEQAPLSIDGSASDRCDLVVPAKSGVITTYESPHMESGLHDLATILIWDVDDFPLEPDERMRTSDFFFSVARARVAVGASESRSEPQPHELEGEPMPSSLGYLGVLVAEQSEFASALPVVRRNSAPGEKISLFVHMGNHESEDGEFALVALLDGRQIPLVEPGESIVYSLPPTSIGTVEFEFEAPRDPGVHELLVLRMNDPWGGGLGETPNYGVSGSVRIPIVVR